MRRTAPVGLVVFWITGVAALAQTHPDLSGTWKMDPARSETAHQDVPVGQVSLVVAQTGSEVAVEIRTNAKDRAAIANEKLTYRLDGVENTAMGDGQVPIVCKAHWDGADLVTETRRNLRDSTVTTRWVFSMDPGGRELTVRKALTVQHGYQSPTVANNVGTAKDVFVKQR